MFITEAKAADAAKESPAGEETVTEELGQGEGGKGAAGGWATGWGWSGISGITNVIKDTVHQTAQVVQSTTDVVTEKVSRLVEVYLCSLCLDANQG